MQSPRRDASAVAIQEAYASTASLYLFVDIVIDIAGALQALGTAMNGQLDTSLVDPIARF